MDNGETELLAKMQKGDVRALAKAITLVESSRKEDRIKAEVLLKSCLSFSGLAKRIAISGVPGAGKSSLINVLAQTVLNEAPDSKVAVLSVDPSSSLSKGSLLGDKLRMADLSSDLRVFIRPSSSGGMLGGIHPRTNDVILLLEAASFNYVFIETVGVGQSESQVNEISDYLVLLHLPKSGDDVQGLKKGVYELADVVVVHKADGDGLAAAQADCAVLKSAQALSPGLSSRPVVTCSSKSKDGVLELWKKIRSSLQTWEEDGTLKAKRTAKARAWLRSESRELWLAKFEAQPELSELIKRFSAEVEAKRCTYQEAARKVLEGFKYS